MNSWIAWLAALALVISLGAFAPARAQDTGDEQVTETSEESTEWETRETTPAPRPGAASGQGQTIEATIEQIEQLIAAPPSARLGREVDEPDRPASLFDDPRRVRALLGEDPGYVYVPAGNAPMIVPWGRERVMAAELVAEAQQLLAEGKLDEALVKVNQVLEKFPKAEGARQALELRNQIERRMVAAGPTTGEAPVAFTPVSLPPWVEQNTRGVMFDKTAPKGSTVLIGDYVLAAGDSIPNYPGIRIKEIAERLVVFDFQGEQFRLQVEGE